MRSGGRDASGALILYVALACAPCRAADKAPSAVFSSETGPYREAFLGLRQEIPGDISAYFLNKEEPRAETLGSVVLAFGSKATLRKYPEGTFLVYAMAPGTELKGRKAVKICMEPKAGVLLAELKKIQPHLRRLGVLWVSSEFGDYLAEAGRDAAALGLELESAQVWGDDVPERLRELYGKVDAFWLPPDPFLLNATVLSVFIEFSRSNRLPLYVPTRGLLEQGATASVGPTFREMGRLAGAAALGAPGSFPRESRIRAEKVEVAVNREAAERIGLTLSQEALRKAVKVSP